MNVLKYNKKQLKYLSFILKIDLKTLVIVLANIQDYYQEREEIKVDKKTGNPKLFKDGSVKTRIISQSFSDLKLIQKRIKLNILAKLPLEENVYGGVKKKNNILNARKHQGKNFKLTTDLMDFFPTITSKMVKEFFLEQGYSEYSSTILTSLITFKNKNPQGTHTSTHLANLIFLKADKLIINICKQNGITYTRFIDDLTLSSQNDFRKMIPVIFDIIKHHGFKIHYRKTKYGRFQNITGIPVYNNFLGIPLEIQKKINLEAQKGILNGPYSNYGRRINNA